MVLTLVGVGVVLAGGAVLYKPLGFGGPGGVLLVWFGGPGMKPLAARYKIQTNNKY